MSSENGDGKEKKRPRGIRFTDSGYAKLQKAVEMSEFSHIDDFILNLLKGKTNKVKMDALLRKVKDAISQGTTDTLEGVRELLDEYTRPQE